MWDSIKNSSYQRIQAKWKSEHNFHALIASKQVLEKRRKQTDDDDHDLQVLQPAWKKKKKEQMWARRILDTNFCASITS